IWRNSTEGGEAPLLYYLHDGLHNSVFPESICPYATRSGHDLECAGLDSHRSKNPLAFTIESMSTYYEEATIKAQLVAKKSSMPLSTNMISVTHYYPCIGDRAFDEQCQIDKCTLCPPELPMSTCCVPSDDYSGITIEGEFIAHSRMVLDGGHVMLLVGYNDVFQTRDGYTGGFIVKNSWSDDEYQGSHSMQYWLQKISEWDERFICPNSFNPFNWYIASDDDGLVGIESCLSKDSKDYAHLNHMPLHLNCVDANDCDPNMTYFALNTTSYGDHMTIMCLYEYNSSSNLATEMCLDAMRPSKIATIFRPVEIYPNNPDLCGFYFIPYEVNRKITAQFQGFFVNSFDISWAPQSYVANQHNFPQYDYTLLQNSTKTQRGKKFDGPFPSAHVFKAHHHTHK
ncbi:hypothetical protein THRCLA_09705, partial [Thraustotheca clavata]